MGWNQLQNNILQNNILPSVRMELSCSFISSSNSSMFILVMDISETSAVPGWLGQSLELQSQTTLSLSNKSEQILCLNCVRIYECTYSHLSRRESILSGQCPAMFLKVRRLLLDSFLFAALERWQTKDKAVKTNFCNVFVMLILPGKGRYLQATVKVCLHSLAVLYKVILFKYV